MNLQLINFDANLLLPLALLAVAGTLIVYHHFGYPLLIARLARKKADQHQPQAPILYPELTAGSEKEIGSEFSERSELKDGTDEKDWPGITLLIPIYNEGALVAEKLRNLAIVDYPTDKLTIRLLFDGCTDNSLQFAKDALNEPLCQHLNCELMDSPVNKGKLAQLNSAISEAGDEIVALTDLSALIAVDSLKIAALWFEKQEVGAVCATYRFLSSAEVQEQSYWQYQCAIKQAESDLGSTLGAHGAFYLIRQSLFTPLSADTINDDFILPCEVIRQGYRVIYEPRMVAIELENSALEQDFKRRLRISAGNMQQSLRLTQLLSPSYGTTGWMFFSCKWLRPFIPWCFVICLLSSIWLSVSSLIFLPVLLVQVLVYALVLKQEFAPSKSGILIKLHYLISGHFIGLIGGLCYLRGDYKTSWKRG
ncbi:glycosyltransferase family 2 protein [Oceanospirillum sanctuarii]|uniref:glycosyltransferase family 2 protein n=1 Tax=Oceanospirillum sanctuarii TaxID=1434821 RepID=UPI000A3C276B|nr:glycosyltransferase family 2 protein [Oceanospirillum sanctuarii]